MTRLDGMGTRAHEWQLEVDLIDQTLGRNQSTGAERGEHVRISAQLCKCRLTFRREVILRNAPGKIAGSPFLPLCDCISKNTPRTNVSRSKVAASCSSASVATINACNTSELTSAGTSNQPSRENASRAVSVMFDVAGTCRTEECQRSSCGAGRRSGGREPPIVCRCWAQPNRRSEQPVRLGPNGRFLTRANITVRTSPRVTSSCEREQTQRQPRRRRYGRWGWCSPDTASTPFFDDLVVGQGRVVVRRV